MDDKETAIITSQVVRTILPALGKVLTTTSADITDWKVTLDTLTAIPGVGVKLDKGYLSFTKTGRKMNDGSVIAELVKHFGVVSAPPYLAALSDIMRSSWDLENPETTDVDITLIPQRVHDIIHHYVRWSSIQGGTKVYLVRTSEANTWEIAIDPWGALTQYKHPSGGNYLTFIADKVKHLQKTGETTWGVDIEVNQRSGVRTRSITPFLTLVQDVTGILQDDLRFYMPMPETFSNDPEIPASSFFPLNDLDVHLTGTCEHWLDFESQMPEWAQDAWRATFYAAFDDQNRSRQMAILYDNGQTGKSNMFRAVAAKTAGGFYAPLSKDSLSNQFWGSKIFGKRLVLFSDSGNTKISQMDKIKQISGGDPIDVELKGINSQIRYIPNCRVWISTNRRPEINTYARHQLSRVLIFPLTPTTNERILKKFSLLDNKGELVRDDDGHTISIGADYDKLMAEEFYDYLNLCRKSYAVLCPNGQDIVVPHEMTEYIKLTCVSSGTDALDLLFSSYLIMEEDAMITNVDLKILLDYMIGEARQPDLTYEDVATHIQDMGGKRHRMRRSDLVTRGWKGVGLRSHIQIIRDTVVIAKATTTAPLSTPLPGLEDLD